MKRSKGEGALDTVKVAFATEQDEAWLIENDSNTYISADLVADKIRSSEYIVARVGRAYVGYVRIGTFWSFIPFIDIIAVEDDWQRQGIGRAMLTFLEEHARNRGQTMIMSSSQADEPGAQAWHRKVGFKDAGAIIDLAPLQHVPEILFVKRIANE